MKSDKEIFVEWLKKALKLESSMTGKELAGRVGVSPSTISGWFGDKSAGPKSMQVRLDICKELKADYNSIIQDARTNIQQDFKVIESENQDDPTPEKVSPFRSKLEQDHFKTIQKFKNPEDAKEFNDVLLELERLDIEKFYSWFGDIKGYVKKLQKLEQKKIEEARKKEKQTPDEKQA